jgi:cephalosporin-C deacetylase
MPGRYPGLLLLPGYASPPAEPPSVLAGKGYAVLAIAVQGEPGAAPAAATGSYVTTGIGDAQTYVYRQIVGHVVRAFDFLAERPEVDPGRIAVTGPGEGGGLALLLAALEPRVAAVMSDVPFLADFPRSIGRGGWPYLEIADYIKASPDREAAVRRTLSYFDAVNFAARVRAPVFMSVGLRDTACRPETAYAVFNALAGPRQMKVYPDAGHEGGGAAHWLAKLDWLGRVLAAPPAGTPQ